MRFDFRMLYFSSCDDDNSFCMSDLLHCITVAEAATDVYTIVLGLHWIWKLSKETLVVPAVLECTAAHLH